jgi:hypothetical protein
VLYLLEQFKASAIHHKYPHALFYAIVIL